MVIHDQDLFSVGHIISPWEGTSIKIFVPLPRLGFDLHLSSEHRNPFLHTDKTQTFFFDRKIEPIFNIKTLPGVFHSEHNIGETGYQTNGCLTGLGMFFDVIQPFLNQAVKSDLGIIIKLGFINSNGEKLTLMLVLAEKSSQYWNSL